MGFSRLFSVKLNREAVGTTLGFADSYGGVRVLDSPEGRHRYLGEALVGVATELRANSAIGFRVVMIGRHRELNKSIWDDVYQIAREAIVNAFRHSSAKEIETDIEYMRNGLRICVRDNGCGFDSRKLQTRCQEDGCEGLQGMRVRAERIEAQLRLWSGGRMGTEVELSVPGHVAFENDF